MSHEMPVQQYVLDGSTPWLFQGGPTDQNWADKQFWIIKLHASMVYK